MFLKFMFANIKGNLSKIPFVTKKVIDVLRNDKFFYNNRVVGKVREFFVEKFCFGVM